jgi:hypothetical protein
MLNERPCFDSSRHIAAIVTHPGDIFKLAGGAISLARELRAFPTVGYDDRFEGGHSSSMSGSIRKNAFFLDSFWDFFAISI